MPAPRNHDDQPKCDECQNYAEWHDGEQKYLCQWCEPEPVAEEVDEPCEYDDVQFVDEAGTGTKEAWDRLILPGGFY